MGKELLFQEIMTDIGIVFVKGRGEKEKTASFLRKV